MTAVQLNAMNAELFGALQTISSDESLMKKAVRALKRIASQSTKAENTMSMAELEEIVRQGEKEIAEGNLQPIAIENLWK